MPSMFAPTDNPVIFAIVVVLNVPLFMAIGRRVFGNAAEWKAAILDAFRVKHIVPIRGFRDRPWLGGKFWLFFFCCFVAVVVEYALFAALIAKFIAGSAEN